MEFGDYSPPREPTFEEQADALQKGLGRAVLWAMQGKLDDGPLLAACLRDQRYDQMIDEIRGDWLWQIIQATGAADRIRDPLLKSLDEERDVAQLCALARHYAAGDNRFRSRLYQIVEQRPYPDSRWFGEDDIVALDGESAFLFSARIRGRELADREWEWDDGHLVESAIELFGKQQVLGWLEDPADEAPADFRKAGSKNNGKLKSGWQASPQQSMRIETD